MRIDPINSKIASEIKKIEKAKKVDKTHKTKASLKPDTTSFSTSAQRLSETKTNIDIVSEIRKEKVEEVRNKINQGYYNSPEFVDKLAEKLLTFFGISEK